MGAVDRAHQFLITLALLWFPCFLRLYCSSSVPRPSLPSILLHLSGRLRVSVSRLCSPCHTPVLSRCPGSLNTSRSHRRSSLLSFAGPLNRIRLRLRLPLCSPTHVSPRIFTCIYMCLPVLPYMLAGLYSPVFACTSPNCFGSTDRPLMVQILYLLRFLAPLSVA